MKRFLLALALMIISVSAFSHFNGSILVEEDFLLAKEDNSHGPALSSAPNEEIQWESFNQWMCFPSVNLSYECAQYDEKIFVPSIRVQTEEQEFHFDTHVEDQIPCKETLINWRRMATESSEVCVFAAPMPDTNMGEERGIPQSLWYIHTLKTADGYWHARGDLYSEYGTEF
jgi:hypothetical protein